MKWNLRMTAAQQDIWRPSELLIAFERVGFTPSLSKVAQLWSKKPISLRLDELDKICAALDCTVADLLEAEPVAATDTDRSAGREAVGENRPGGGPVRPTPRTGRTGGRRSLPPN
ncbi:helix-turn-helix domain-containing protein [Rhodococcus sp. NPDC127530]|uniref:helix-turn-helix domain-containing protein n=1 Tax=unclassified Rhodococcus (in: high G+C Gram-positive bacteria) TaxID=192944 RepID=UPI003634DD87